MTDQALIRIDPHGKGGPIILHPDSHVIVHTDVMGVEVHMCHAEALVITAADGTLDVEGCPCGLDHHYSTAREYLDAADRQGIPIDYV
jgi:hypothetical protein